MRQYDILQRFLFDNSDVRGELVHLHAVIQAVKTIHPYPDPIIKVLGQCFAAVSLLAATIKFEGSLILQIHSEGPIQLLVAQSDEFFHVRGLATWQTELLEKELMLTDGQLAITLIPKNKEERYQGIVKITGGEVSVALENYFAQSEQLATKVILAGDDQYAAGLLLQKMPSTDESAWQYWEHITTLAQTISAKELLNLPNEEILHRLFHEETVRLFDSSPVAFRCSCTFEKMEQAIITYGKKGIDEILETQPLVEVTCEFCNRKYTFDKVDLTRIFHTG